MPFMERPYKSMGVGGTRSTAAPSQSGSIRCLSHRQSCGIVHARDEAHLFLMRFSISSAEIGVVARKNAREFFLPCPS